MSLLHISDACPTMKIVVFQCLTIINPDHITNNRMYPRTLRCEKLTKIGMYSTETRR